MENQIFLRHSSLNLGSLFCAVFTLHILILFYSLTPEFKSISYSLKESDQVSIKVKSFKAQIIKEVQKKIIVKKSKAINKSNTNIDRKIEKKQIKKIVKSIELNSTKETRGRNTDKAFYLSQVRNQINNKKSYPKIAKRLRHEGQLKVELLIDSSGKIISTRYLKKSSSRILDKAAEELLRSLDSFGQIPTTIKERPLRAVIPISYNLI